MPELCHTTQDLINALRARKTALGLSNVLIDDLAGYHPGMWDKMCGPANVRVLSLNCLLTFASALGLAIQLVEDPDCSARIAKRWERRESIRVHDNGRISKEAAVRIAWSLVLSKANRKAGQARWRNSTPEQRLAFSEKGNRAKAAKHQARLEKIA